MVLPPAPAPDDTPAPAEPAGRSCRAHASEGFGPLLGRVGVSLLVSTYQANKLILLRAGPGGLNVHLRQFDKPMGVALAGDRLAVGTAREVREYHNAPAVARAIDAAGNTGAAGATRHDACFVPRLAHVTGDVQIHEMAWVTGGGGGEGGAPELWFVNTRFSCLAVRSTPYSFVPVWRPPFVSALAPEDRCHLNGLGLRDGLPRYVTALGETDTPAGWRDNKKGGGVLMRLPDDLGPVGTDDPGHSSEPVEPAASVGGEVIARGLCMPHSPRWHAGRLWVLESGLGTVGVVDEADGRCREVARLPGFTRGLDFAILPVSAPASPAASVAFVGLSQVRESAVFSGIPIADLPPSQRRCGVWAVDVATGQTLAYLQFDSGVQEIFAVQATRHRYPEVLEDAQKDLIDGSFILPREALRQVPPPLRQPASG